MLKQIEFDNDDETEADKSVGVVTDEEDDEDDEDDINENDAREVADESDGDVFIGDTGANDDPTLTDGKTHEVKGDAGDPEDPFFKSGSN